MCKSYACLENFHVFLKLKRNCQMSIRGGGADKQIRKIDFFSHFLEV